MILTEKETTAIEDLKTQEQACIEKYTKYSNQAKDPVLKELFEEIARDEQKHFDSLDQVLKGKVPSVDCNDSKGKDYSPAATYDSLGNSEDKKADCYLATDCIGTESQYPESTIPMYLYLEIGYQKAIGRYTDRRAESR